MNHLKAAAAGFAVGSACMYYFDPARGKRRRAGVRDHATAAWNDVTNQLDKAQRDLINRTHGALAATKAVFTDHRTNESVLIPRVRSRVGRVISHPHAITVRAEDSRIVLEGAVLKHELHALLSAVRSVPGVSDVVNRLTVYDEAGDVSSLQGGVPRESRSEFMQQNWTPVLRVASAAAGSALIWYGLRRESALKLAGRLAGSALLARAIANKEFRQMLGVGGRPPALEYDKAVHVLAPPDEVYAFWANYANFPRFMAHLKEVRDLGGGRSHWVAEGPGGVPVSWDAEITECVPNKVLGWRSLPGSQVRTQGVVRFDSNPDGSTRVGIRLCYSPPAGMLGHFIASIFGADPKHEMDEDLVRFKSLIEIGKTRAHGSAVTVDELKPTSVPLLRPTAPPAAGAV